MNREYSYGGGRKAFRIVKRINRSTIGTLVGENYQNEFATP